MKKERTSASRLDEALVGRGLCESRERAKRAVLAGRVRVNGQPARKASDRVRAEDRIEIAASERYASRGGHKLEHALTAFNLDVRGAQVMDIGASTGGFTDCLLQHGAAHVYALDVGRGQLAWKLRQDDRVTAIEGVNARYLRPADLPGSFQPTDLAVIDCSFISLRHVLPPVAAQVRPGGRIVALIKPQFEAGRAEADRGRGVIRDPAVHERILRELEAFVGRQRDLRWRAVAASPMLGPAGNREFLLLLEKTQ